MKCLCKTLNLKVGDKVKWNGKNTPSLRPNDSFIDWYVNQKDTIFTVGLVNHLSGWKTDKPECFVCFLECNNRSGWGLSELEKIKIKKLKVNLP